MTDKTKLLNQIHIFREFSKEHDIKFKLSPDRLLINNKITSEYIFNINIDYIDNNTVDNLINYMKKVALLQDGNEYVNTKIDKKNCLLRCHYYSEKKLPISNIPDIINDYMAKHEIEYHKQIKINKIIYYINLIRLRYKYPYYIDIGKKKLSNTVLYDIIVSHLVNKERLFQFIKTNSKYMIFDSHAIDFISRIYDQEADNETIDLKISITNNDILDMFKMSFVNDILLITEHLTHYELTKNPKNNKVKNNE